MALALSLINSSRILTFYHQDGFQATAAIRQYERSSGKKRTPIIGLNGHTRELRTEAVRAGMDDTCITRPVKFVELCEVIKGALCPDDEKFEKGDSGWVLVEAIDAADGFEGEH